MRRHAAAAALLALAVAASAASPWEASVCNAHWGGLRPLPEGGWLLWGTDARLWRRNGAAGGAWVDTQAPHHADVRSVALVEPGLVVAVGDGGLLLRSTDGGQRWQADDEAASGPLAAVDAHGGVALAAGAAGTLLRLRGGEARWQRLAGPGRGYRQVLALGERRWWLAGDGPRVWESTDDGEHWQPRASPGGEPDALAVDGASVLAALPDGRLRSLAPQASAWRQVHRAARGSYARLQPLPNGGLVATGSLGACAWRAHPAGRWRDCTLPRRQMVHRIAATPDGRAWLAVGESGLLMLSTDQGRRWRPAPALPAALADRHLADAAWDAATQAFVVVGAGGLIASGDARSAAWRIVHAGPAHYVHELAVLADGSYLAAASHRTLARSTDGCDWRSHIFAQLHEPAYLMALHIDASGKGIAVGGGQGAVLVSTDGRRWKHHSSGHGIDHLGALGHPSEPVALLYGVGGRVLRVDLRTGEWRAAALPAAQAVFAGAVSAAGRWYLAGDGGAVLHAADADGRWQLASVPGAPALRAAALSPDGHFLLVAGAGAQGWRAPLDAAGVPGPWTALALPAVARWAFIAEAEAGRALWLGGSEGLLLRSTDAGASWTLVPTGTRAALRQPSRDPRNGRWWMPGRNGVLLASDDDGQTWQAVPTGTRAALKGVRLHRDSGDVLAYGERIVRLRVPAP